MQKWTWVGKGRNAAPAQGLQAPHRGRAGPLRAISVGGVGRPFDNTRHPFDGVGRIATDCCDRLKLPRGLPADSASTSWRVMPRVMNTMRERRRVGPFGERHRRTEDMVHAVDHDRCRSRGD